MIIRKYTVKSMHEAMNCIKKDLGQDAVIISKRKIRKLGFLGFFSKKLIEVTAVVDNDKKNVKESIKNFKRAMEHQRQIQQFKDKDINKNVIKDVTKREIASDKEENSHEILKEMKEMLKDMKTISQKENIKKRDFQIKLEENDLEKEVIKEILLQVDSMKEDLSEEKKGKKIIKDMIYVSKEKEDKFMILVGPTGVGKTTTIAKLAGNMALIKKKKVGLITIDTYRIGAVEQLKTYANIMNIPFKVVFSIKEMNNAIDSMKDCDLILIDTTGRNSKNIMQLSELRAFIEKVDSKNIHLVISCTTKDKDIKTILEGYERLNYENIIITKLDETTTYGSILNILYRAKKPISYITTGQNVPEDIKKVDIEEVTSLILGENSIC